MVKSTGDTIVTLADIASVGLGRKEPRLGAATVDTKPAVLLTVTKQPGTGSIGLTEDIDAAIGDLRGSMPESVNVVTDIFRQSDFIGSSITNLQVSLAEGALFVIIVLFFFLMNLRTTLISVVALPVDNSDGVNPESVGTKYQHHDIGRNSHSHHRIAGGRRHR